MSLAQLDERVIDRYARIYKQLRLGGTPIPTNDLWIAACVDDRGDALFSYDAHFDRVDGLQVFREQEDFLALLRKTRPGG